MIPVGTCHTCEQPLELEDAYAIDDGVAEAEVRQWRCGGCGDVTEDVEPVDGFISRVA